MQKPSHILLLGLTLAGLTSVAASQPADIVLKNGDFYTMDVRQPRAKAVAIREGRFVAIGGNTQVKRMIGPNTEVIDLRGRMVIPGINDIHAHPVEGAYEALYSCAIPPQGKVDDVLAAVSACADRAEPKDWIVGGPWSSSLLSALENADALEALDRVSKGYPVVLRDDTFHNRWVNSKVLQLAGIGPGTKAPKGGEYAMADGKPTGLLKEPPAWLGINKLAPARSAERLKKAAMTAAAKLNTFGITSVQDALVDREILSAWHAADTDGSGLPIRVVASLAGDHAEPNSGNPPSKADADRVRSEHLRPNYVKLFLDGVPMAYTSAMLEPYEPSAEHGHDFRGTPLYSLEALVKKLKEADRQGIAAKLHAVGDGAVRLALDAIEAMRKENGMSGPQHQIAHVSFVAPSDIPRFAKLNVVADVSPMLWFPHAYTPLFEHVVGHERTMHSYPIRSLMKGGALVAGGSDWPAGQQTPDPWMGIEGLVTRRNPNGDAPGVLNANERISLDEALRVYTLNSAKGMGLGKETGSIELGKRADFAVLNQNLFKIDAASIHKTKVLATYFEGKQVYRSAGK